MSAEAMPAAAIPTKRIAVHGRVGSNTFSYMRNPTNVATSAATDPNVPASNMRPEIPRGLHRSRFREIHQVLEEGVHLRSGGGFAEGIPAGPAERRVRGIGGAADRTGAPWLIAHREWVAP